MTDAITSTHGLDGILVEPKLALWELRRSLPKRCDDVILREVSPIATVPFLVSRSTEILPREGSRQVVPE